MEACDTLIVARWVAPVVPSNTIYDNHAIAILNGQIIGIAPASEARQRFAAKMVVERDHHLLIPGLINAHTHAAMSLFRGMADDLPLKVWLEEHIWPAESRWIGAAMVADGVRLSIAEMLAGGVSTMGDMYFFPDTVAEVASECRMRAVVGLILVDFPSAWASSADEYLDKAIRVHDALSSNPLVSTQFSPHSPYAVGDNSLRRMRVLADQIEIRTQIHFNEASHELADSLERYGKTPLERLQGLGLVNSMLSVAHAVHLSGDDIRRLAEGSVSVIHCPESNAKLASGLARVTEMQAAGINVALGTDGAASNNDLSMIGEMRTAALLSKLQTGDAAALPAWRVLEMATLNGARALGVDVETGSLEAGKAADIACVDLKCANSWPVYDPVAQLVYTASADQVTDTWVNGKALYADRVHKTLDLEDTLSRASEWHTRISSGA